MAKFNTRSARPQPAVARANSPLKTSQGPADTRTFEGGVAWTKGARTDLFIRASAGFAGGEDSFYEDGATRDDKLIALARHAAIEDFTWFARFVKWLRRTANIRTAALMCAAEGVKARLDAGMYGVVGATVPSPRVYGTPAFTVDTNRSVIDSVLYRADEPGEMLAYWMSRYGRAIPKPVKRGVADGARRLYNERSLLKYDTPSHGVRFGDVLNLVHAAPRRLWEDRVLGVSQMCPHPEKVQYATAEAGPAHGWDATPLRTYLCRCGWFHSTSRLVPFGEEITLDQVPEREVVRVLTGRDPRQSELFQYALDRRHHPEDAQIPETLKVISRNKVLRTADDLGMWLDADFLQDAGMTWEDALSAVGGRGDISKRRLWEAMIPSMGYMALIRNLRNFDEADVSDDVAEQVIAKLKDPGEVARSRQLPFRFYSAYCNVTSLRWGQALERALDLCLPNIPELAGRTLILTDTSRSMTSTVSAKSERQCLEVAALFASALAQRNAGRVDLYQYADFPAAIVTPKGGSVLKMTEAIRRHCDSVGRGTNIAGSVRQTYQNHDRVIIFSDGQGTRRTSAEGVGGSVPANVPVYLFNIQGYSQSPMPTGSAARFDLGGLSDQTFKLIPLLEAGSGAWPWEVEDSDG